MVKSALVTVRDEIFVENQDLLILLHNLNPQVKLVLHFHYLEYPFENAQELRDRLCNADQLALGRDLADQLHNQVDKVVGH